MKVRLIALNDSVLVVIKDGSTTIADRYTFDSVCDAQAFINTL